MVKPFDTVRKQLERQYLDVRYDPASGLSGEELRAALRRHREKNPDEPRILTKAWCFRLLCMKARMAVEPDDYFAGKLEHHDLLIALRNEWLREESRREFGNDPPSVPGAFASTLDVSHTCPDWRSLLACGFTGLRDRAAAQSGELPAAVAMVYDAATSLAKRLGAASSNPALAALAERPPRTFREALQLAYLYHELQEMEGEPIRSMGRFDQLYHRFYDDDLKTGRLTRQQAGELLKYFWIKFFAKTQGKAYGKPFLFGPEANDLSHLAFEVFREIQLVDPKLHVRIAERTPEVFLDQVVGCIQAGCTSIVMANDERQVAMLSRNGKTLEDANDYILIGCYEPAVMGREMNWSTGAVVNLAKAVELVLASGNHASFAELMAAYLEMLDAQFALAADQTRRQERLWPKTNPSPLLSGTMASCLASGSDVSQGGAKYNTTGCVCVGMANAADSLAVVKHLVYQDKLCTMSELKAALAANWQGFGELHLVARNRVPKWGNNDDRVDAIAVKIADFMGRRINREPNARGGIFQAALYGIIDFAKSFGRQTGALPDGRLSGEPLAMNTGATPGMDRNGVTSLINSVTKLDLSLFPSGTVLDVMLHPSVAGGADGLRTISAIVRSHFAQGGMAIQFNIFDANVLRDAQRHPEKYANLQVRVCGWNVRFADLAPAEQALFIAKAEVA